LCERVGVQGAVCLPLFLPCAGKFLDRLGHSRRRFNLRVDPQARW
jgi:hypothetical protein